MRGQEARFVRGLVRPSRMELDRQMLTPPVRRLLADPAAEIEAFSAQPLGGGFAETSGGGLGTVRIEGTATRARGRRSFRMVAKALADGLTGSAVRATGTTGGARRWPMPAGRWRPSRRAWRRRPATGSMTRRSRHDLPRGRAGSGRGLELRDLPPRRRGPRPLQRRLSRREAAPQLTLDAAGAGRRTGSGSAPTRSPGSARRPTSPSSAAWLSQGTLDRTLELWRRRDELTGALRSLPDASATTTPSAAT